MTPDELGDMEPREFMNKLLGFMDLEMERRLWMAWVEVSNNPYNKDRPGSFKQFCDKMKGENKTPKLTEKQFFNLLGIE
jgi:hypothetical protein